MTKYIIDTLGDTTRRHLNTPGRHIGITHDIALGLCLQEFFKKDGHRDIMQLPTLPIHVDSQGLNAAYYDTTHGAKVELSHPGVSDHIVFSLKPYANSSDEHPLDVFLGTVKGIVGTVFWIPPAKCVSRYKCSVYGNLSSFKEACPIINFVDPNYIVTAQHHDLWGELTHMVKEMIFTPRFSYTLDSIEIAEWKDWWIVSNHTATNVHGDKFKIRLQHRVEQEIDNKNNTIVRYLSVECAYADFEHIVLANTTSSKAAIIKEEVHDEPVETEEERMWRITKSMCGRL